MSNLADYLQDLVMRRGFSLRRLASESGVSASTFSRWLDGKQVPSLKSCQRMADYLTVPVEQVLAMAGHLTPIHKVDPSNLPEFGDYARQKYPDELDEDTVHMIEDLIFRRRSRRGGDGQAERGTGHSS